MRPFPVVGWLAVLAALLAALAALGAAPQHPRTSKDPVERVRGLVQRYLDGKRELAEDDAAELEPLVAELRMIQVTTPDRRREVFLALLDLAALHPTRPPARSRNAFEPPSPREQAAALAYEALGRALDLDDGGELSRWVASSVLAEPGVHGLERRRAALEAYAGRHEPAILLALMAAATDGERKLREAAMRALAGWDDDGVHRFMVTQLRKCRASSDWLPPELVRAHFRSVSLEPDSAGARALHEVLRADVLGDSWRPAVRALRLLRCVDDALAVPLLIDALSAWISRGAQAGGSRRVEDEIHRQLKERSGKSIGPHPERWAQWWKAVRSGALPARSDEPQQVTRASFFGLRPATDRVTFVIDRSGSMSALFGRGERTRYDEALRQMSAFVSELGDKARFRVVMFDSDVRAWKDRLAPASPANVTSAEQWAAGQLPAGGTELRPAIEHVLRVGRDGRCDVERIEEDTVIVLCDGATAEGSGWVRPLLERVGDEACVVFDCVQIGGGSDGTLELLAELTDGQFVRVDG